MRAPKRRSRRQPPRDIVGEAVLKKEEEIEKLLNTTFSQRFMELLTLGKRITDYKESHLDEVQEDRQGEEDGLEILETEALQMRGFDDIEEADEGLNVQDMDAYRLRRKLSQAYGTIDPQHGQKLAEDVFKMLGERGDREMENRLVMLLEYKVVWCTRLARAEDDKERKKIEEEMTRESALLAILEQLHATRATAKERQKKGQHQLFDLEQPSFSQESLLMANNRCKLPTKSYRTTGKGYEEVHIPHFAKGEEMVKITDMPDWAQAAFPGVETLNTVQSRVYETAIFTPVNLLVCAPTGAGKANVAMLTILHEIGKNRKEDGSIDLTCFKIVYVTPMKALVAELVETLSNRLQSYGFTVKELTGDLTLSKQQIEETQIIVTTPEKWDVIWDIITRKYGDGAYTQMEKVLILDEIHLLLDNCGPLLESILARTVRHMDTTQDFIRLVGLSATLPNYQDVALLLEVDKTKGLFYFDSSH